MHFFSSISSDILASVTVLFTINLAFRNQIINKKNTQSFIKALFVVLLLLALDVGIVFIEAGKSDLSIILHTLFCAVMYTLAPVVAYILVQMNYEEDKQAPAFVSIPIYINGVFCLFSILKSWVFFVDCDNDFVRGRFFMVPVISCLIYIIALVVMTFRSNDRFDRGERAVVTAIYVVIAFSIGVDLIDAKTRLVWPMVAICLLLYYVFLRELQFKFDALTQIRNRAAFEKMMQCYISNNKKAIVVCDLNDLKYINDEIGHQAGDEAIRTAAQIIKASFSRIGTCYRIGGDEFCIISETNQRNRIEDAIQKMESVLFMRNQSRYVPLRIAHGYATFEQTTKNDIYGVFSAADQAMYENKTAIKEKYNMREIMTQKREEEKKHAFKQR